MIVSIIISKITVASTLSPLTRGRCGCLCRHRRTLRLLSSLQIRLHSTGSSTIMRSENMLSSAYIATLSDRYACCRRYDVKERKLAKGDSSLRFSGAEVTRLYPNNLFALAKSYVARSIAASDSGLSMLGTLSLQCTLGKLTERQKSL